MTALVADSGLPKALAVGPCIEVWAEDGAPIPSYSARVRFNEARGHWLSAHGIDTEADRCHTIPNGAPWSIDDRPDTGRRVSVRGRLRRAGATRKQLASLRRQAATLLDVAQ